ncbi:hypothetical protein BN3087_720004 [Sulfurovum sp. enrichment culture clone C5]|uniref:Uncharacterized protein n=1 Tax=Sulfurovum sp. enrichment culture clone C5 TaxID=497650 RepID=A0A0S4XPR0_9BACT|nr:hypothetical protein BN3087_720004 [Sulfurovum sp. enrichment culture clone C5]
MWKNCEFFLVSKVYYFKKQDNEKDYSSSFMSVFISSSYSKHCFDTFKNALSNLSGRLS